MEIHEEIMNRLESNNYESFYIGGYVRDLLLGLKSKDIDIVTSATPRQILDLFHDKKTNLVGTSFGVVKVEDIDISTYRTEICSGIKHNDIEVEYAKTLKEDCQRRDFTINAIAMTKDNYYIDLVNGLEDLRNKVIRFIGNPEDRIFEDPLRILRACRFLSYDERFMFDDDTFKALAQNREKIALVSQIRIRYEIIACLSKVQKASRFFDACSKVGILDYIFPSIEDAIDVKQNRYHNEDLYEHLMLTGDYITTEKPLLKLAGYLHDVGKVDTKAYNKEKQDYTFLRHENTGAELVENELDKLAFFNDEISYITNLISLHMRSFKNISDKAIRKILGELKKYDISYQDFFRLKIADRYGNKAENKPDFTYKFIIETARHFRKVINEKQPIDKSNLAINGNDVMALLDLKPGPKVGIVIKHLEELVLDNPVFNTKEILGQLVINYFGIEKGKGNNYGKSS